METHVVVKNVYVTVVTDKLGLNQYPLIVFCNTEFFSSFPQNYKIILFATIIAQILISQYFYIVVLAYKQNCVT